MVLNKIQQKQLNKQLKAHLHNKYRINIILNNKNILKNFAVLPKVHRPEKMTSVILAKWLFNNKGLYFGKKCLDMGCGSGIQGIVMALYGARKVMFSDLSHSAAENTKENIVKFRLENKSEVFQGDLFEKIREKVDFIVFNHPFFSDHTIEQLLVLKSTIKRGNLIHLFLENAKLFLNKGGKIVMPYFHLAGSVNDPEIQAPQHGYKVMVRFRKIIDSGLQRGFVSIYELSIK